MTMGMKSPIVFILSSIRKEITSIKSSVFIVSERVPWITLALLHSF